MKLKATVLLSTLVLSGAVSAQTAAAEPDYTLTSNVGAVTEYRYRGISQSRQEAGTAGWHRLRPQERLLSGHLGIHHQLDQGLLQRVAAAKGPVEVDLYGGYKGAITDTFGFDVGGLQYWYPGTRWTTSPARTPTPSSCMARSPPARPR